MNWRDLERFPVPDSQDWRARKANSRRDTLGKDAVEAELNRWSPFDPILISAPGFDRFRHVLAIDMFRGRVERSFLQRVKMSILILFSAAGISGGLGLLKGNSLALQTASLIFGIAIFALLDYRLVLRHPNALSERALFCFWVRERSKSDLIAWGGLMFFCGAIQYAGEQYLGGYEQLLLRWGAVFAPLAQGEAWRVLTGPFIHANFMHWASNTVMLLLAAAIAGRISRAHGLAAFLIGSTCGVFLTWMISPIFHYDGYAGVSAGVTAMFGYCGGAGLQSPSKFPVNFSVSIIAFSILDIYLSALTNPGSAIGAHAVGLLVGIFCGYFFRPSGLAEPA